MPDQFNNGGHRKPYATVMTGTAESNVALLLVESLIHGLIARSILTVQEAIDIIQIAADVEHQLDEARTGPTARFQSALTPLALSLAVDLDD